VKNIDGGETLLYIRRRATTASNQGLAPKEKQTYSFALDKRNKVIRWEVPSPVPQGC